MFDWLRDFFSVKPEPLHFEPWELNPKARSSAAKTKSAVGLLPEWGNATDVRVPGRSYRKDSEVTVNLGTYTCDSPDPRCAESRTAKPASLGRCCPHVARAIVTNAPGDWPDLLIQVLASCGDYHLPPSFESAIFTNGEDQFLALYGIDRGYVQLFGPLGGRERTGNFGYDISQNRWGWGAAPKHPLIIKKEMRPWIRGLDAHYRK